MNKAHETGEDCEGFNAEDPESAVVRIESLQNARALAIQIAALRIRRALDEAHETLPDEDAEELEAEIWGLATEEDDGR